MTRMNEILSEISGTWDDSDWSAWAVGLIEPLIDPVDRVTVLERMRAQYVNNTTRATTLMAGVLADLLDSLPEGDMWRNVNPATFGNWHDGTDLVDIDTPHIRDDIGLAALARPLDRDAARMVAAAASGAESVARVLDTAADPVTSFTHAASWLTWRRRAYLGHGEPYPLILVFSWLPRARRAADGEPVTETLEQRRVRAQARITD